jgi:hypothetical protein
MRLFLMPLKPFIIAEPPVLQPYSVGFYVVGTITNNHSGGPYLVAKKKKTYEPNTNY